MKKKLRIGMAQINTTVGDLKSNTEKILDYTSKAKKAAVDIVSFPELAITGYPPEDLLFNSQFIKRNRECLNSIADHTEKITLIVGMVDKSTDIYNAAAVICNKKIVGIYRKILLPNYGVFDEKRYFTPGNSYPIFYMETIPFAVNICEDIWDADGPTKIQSGKGNAPIIFNISSSPYYMGRASEREQMLRKRAVENRVYIAYNNLVGGQDELVFDGGGMILDTNGKIIARGKQFEEDLILQDIEVEPLIPAHRKPDKKDNICTVTLPVTLSAQKKKPLKQQHNNITTKGHNRTVLAEEVYSALVTGTRDYVQKNGFTNVVIGLSGGIDSALTATIAVDALSKNTVTGVSMPSPYSSPESIDDAAQLASNLGIQHITIPIDSIFAAYTNTLSTAFCNRQEGITEENIQARIRGNLLMALSNKFHWLVLTTGNKSETGVGYCTLYGDMAGGFAILKDVPKTLVYTLASHRNSLSDTDIIPNSTLTKAPSAELRPDQKDEDSLPPYSVLDPILQAYIEENKTIAEIAVLGYNKKTILETIRLVENNEYKRRQSPPGIKITPKAFGRDRRFPITNKYRE